MILDLNDKEVENLKKFLANLSKDERVRGMGEMNIMLNFKNGNLVTMVNAGVVREDNDHIFQVGITDLTDYDNM